MVNEPEKQPGDPQEENQSPEIPLDRLEQLEQAETEPSQSEAKKKTRRKSSGRRKLKQEPVQDEAPAKEQEKEPETREVSKDDLLADIRQSLVAEEEVEEKTGLFGRFRKSLKKTPKQEEKQDDLHAELDALLKPQDELKKSVIEQKQKQRKPGRNKDEEKAIQEFFADLDALADITVEDYVPPIPESREGMTVEERESEVAPSPSLPVKTRVDEEVDFDAIREAALAEYDETKIEIEERKPDLREEVRETIRESRPFERFLLIGAGVLTVLILLFTGSFLIVNSISVPTRAPTATIDLKDVIYPTQLTLPGGWEFGLGRGQVVDGEWNPQRAEWLVGTEISRWVALPWSLQLEAVLRTLKPEDQLELSMSNFDVLVFNVYSIRELSMEQLLASDPMTPSLLVVLYNDEEPDGTYWVVEARP